MGNSGDVQFRPQLELWAQGEDAVLAEAAAWALERLAGDAAAAQDGAFSRLETSLAGPLA